MGMPRQREQQPVIGERVAAAGRRSGRRFPMKKIGKEVVGGRQR